MSTASSQPWRDLPNPHGFPDLREQVRSIPADFAPRPRQDFSGNRIQYPKGHQLIVPFGKDWVGRSFGKGDLVLATGVGENSFVEVDEIVLTNGDGEPYFVHPERELHLDEDSGEIYAVTLANYDYTELQLVDPSWIGPQLGLLRSGQPRYRSGLPKSFTRIVLQSLKVRAKPLLGDGKRRSLSQGQISVLDQPTDRNLLKLYDASREIPLVGAPIRFTRS